MWAELFDASGRDQARHSDEAAVALGQFRPFPDVTEEDVVGEFDELGSEIADCPLRGCRFGHSGLPSMRMESDRVTARLPRSLMRSSLGDPAKVV
jgi:hypothetical protein